MLLSVQEDGTVRACVLQLATHTLHRTEHGGAASKPLDLQCPYYTCSPLHLPPPPSPPGHTPEGQWSTRGWK